jgi:hypothetical protein
MWVRVLLGGLPECLRYAPLTQLIPHFNVTAGLRIVVGAVQLLHWAGVHNNRHHADI